MAIWKYLYLGWFWWTRPFGFMCMRRTQLWFCDKGVLGCVVGVTLLCACFVYNYLVGFVMYAGQGSTLAVSSHAVVADKFQNPLFHNFTIWYQKSITHRYKIASAIWLLIDVIWFLYLQLSGTTVFVGGAICHWSFHTLSSLPPNVETKSDFEAMNLLSMWTYTLIQQIINKSTLNSMHFIKDFHIYTSQ